MTLMTFFPLFKVKMFSGSKHWFHIYSYGPQHWFTVMINRQKRASRIKINNILLVVGGKNILWNPLRPFSLSCYLKSFNVLLLLAPRFLSVASTCFSSLCRASNAKWWGDKTLSIKTCFMTTWDSWLVLQHENSGGFEAKVSLRPNSQPDSVAKSLRDSRTTLQTFVLTKKSIKHYSAHTFLGYPKPELSWWMDGSMIEAFN